MKRQITLALLPIGLVIFCLTFAHLTSATLGPASITVANTNDSGAGSLRQAIAEVATGGTINFDATVFGTPHTITLASGELVIDKNLTIHGPGANLLSISGNNASRVFSIKGVMATLDAMKIREGYALDGGGIANSGTLTVSNGAVFGNNAGYRGGGIYNLGSLTISYSIVSSNNCGNSSLAPNDAGYGGGIDNSGTLTVTNSIVYLNNAFPDEGNDIYPGDPSFGGGINGGGTILNSLVINNYASSSGGINGGGTIINSTISGNNAQSVIDYYGYAYGGDGGGVNGVVTIINSTITDNYASRAGGGINGDGQIVNTVVAGNTRSDSYSADISGTVTTASHNLIGDAASSGGIRNGVNGNIVGVNPLLAPLRNNGGPTMTRALMAGSPAINAGDNCVLIANGCGNGNTALLTDQRGMSRNGAVDIGAFERQENETASKVLFDFDGDGRSDISVFRPGDSVWYVDRSTQGFFATQFGLPTDRIVPADYDGDGKTDIAVYRDGVWWRMNSSDLVVSATQFGISGDVPVPADYTGDGRDELAVYRNGEWWSLDLSNGQSSLINFGIATDKPVPADYDGDGRVDQAVYRNGEWHLNRSTLGYTVVSFGLPTDRPVVGDYDGDGRADLAVYRDGTWYLQQSSQGFRTLQFGVASDIPAPADYDGDGKTDAAIYRAGAWWVLKSTGGYDVTQFGLPDDRPAPAAYLR